jgi:hypothetical protein
MSLFGGIVGLVFIGIGVFVAIPKAGPFGVLWTLVATGMTIANLYNAFSSRGIANEIIEVSGDESLKNANPEARLRTLDDLRSKSLITPSEYEQRRNEILKQL